MIGDTKYSFLARKQAISSCELHLSLGEMSNSGLLSAIMKDDFDDFNFSDYYKFQREERALKKVKTEEYLLNESKKKKFRSRKTNRKRDPKTSNWWNNYVIDGRGTFSDLSHRDGRLFAYRFAFSLISVRELVSKIKEKEENFWKKKYDAAGREASPINS